MSRVNQRRFLTVGIIFLACAVSGVLLVVLSNPSFSAGTTTISILGLVLLLLIGYFLFVYLSRDEMNEESARSRYEIAEKRLSEFVTGDKVDVPVERHLSRLFYTTHMRLKTEIEALGLRSNLNLVAGVLITLAGATYLVYMITRGIHEDLSTAPKALGFFLPRITTVIFIEAFAYFFLGLYKSNLAEIKYYQNERTTITAMEIAWRASQMPEISKSTADVIRQIVRTDRNSVTAEVKTSASDQSDILEIVKTLTKVVADSVKPKE